MTKNYDDPNNLLTLDVDLPALYTPLDLRYTINVDLDEKVDDRVAALVTDSSAIKKTYNGGANQLSFNVDTDWLNESIDDRVAALIFDTPYLTKVYDDANNILKLNVDLDALYTPLDGR